MSEQDWIDLGKRAVACEGWRWLPGMRVFGQKRSIAWLYGPHDLLMEGEGHSLAALKERGAVPDLRSPCTLGGAEGLMREAWGDETICIVPDCDRGGTAFSLDNETGDLPIHIERRTREAVVVAALEAAPSKASK